MNVNINGPYIYFTIPIFGGIPVTQTTLSLFLVTVILSLTGYFLGRNLAKRPGKLQVLTEKGVAMLQDLVVQTMGAHNAHWMPFIGTIFLSSVCGTLIGMTGFLRSTTADLSVPLAWSILVSVLIWYNKIKREGFFGWLKSFTEPIIVMTPMNAISEIAQPISMAFRHFGNVVSGNVITSILYAGLSTASAALLGFLSGTVAIPLLVIAVGGAILWLLRQHMAGRIVGAVFVVLGMLGLLQFINVFSGVPILQFGIPAVLSVYFDLFAGFVQAFVFSLLTMVYVAGACPPPAEQRN